MAILDACTAKIHEVHEKRRDEEVISQRVNDESTSGISSRLKSYYRINWDIRMYLTQDSTAI